MAVWDDVNGEGIIMAQNIQELQFESALPARTWPEPVTAAPAEHRRMTRGEIAFVAVVSIGFAALTAPAVVWAIWWVSLNLKN